MRLTKKRLPLYILIVVFASIAFLYYQNNAIGITRFKVSSDKLPAAMEPYRIVQLTDLHSKAFGKEQQRLVRKVNKLKPDLIVVTGDLVDSKRYNEEVSMTLMREIVKQAPVYYVTGNHECYSERFESLEEKLEAAGVHVMRNTNELLEFGSGEGKGTIRIAGVDDPTFYKEADGDFAAVDEEITIALQDTNDDDTFTLLLSHRPELFSIYQKNNIDLTFSGHAHGGQVRLPFVGGLIAPGQGLFPKYDGGKFVEGGSTMIVSRGLGNSIIPQRLFNRPEVVLVELMPAK